MVGDTRWFIQVFYQSWFLESGSATEEVTVFLLWPQASLPPRLETLSNSEHPEAKFLWLRSICLQYKHTDLPNREYVYNKHDEDSSWREHFALWSNPGVTVLNLCPPAGRDQSSALCRNHRSHLVMLMDNERCYRLLSHTVAATSYRRHRSGLTNLNTDVALQTFYIISQQYLQMG